MRRKHASERIKVIRQPVQEHQRLGVRAVFLVGAQCGAFGAAANRAADMAHRNDGVAAGNRKLVDRRYGSLQGIDPPFEPRDGFGRQRSDLLAARFRSYGVNLPSSFSRVLSSA